MRSVNQPQPFDDRSVLRPALRAVDALLDEGATESRGGATAGDDTPPLDPIDALVSIAWFNRYQLGVLVPLVGSVEEPASVVVAVIARAVGFGTASRATIGAATALVGYVRDGDEASIASFLADSLTDFDHDELLAGAHALTAALSLRIADALALDVRDAHRTMLEAVAPFPPEQHDASSCSANQGADDARSELGDEPASNRRAFCSTIGSVHPGTFGAVLGAAPGRVRSIRPGAVGTPSAMALAAPPR